MSNPSIRRTFHIGKGRHGAKVINTGEEPENLEAKPPVPRKAQLMAFAIVFDEWLANGKVKDYAELSNITGLDRSRITRIMNLRLLPPGEQEALLRVT